MLLRSISLRKLFTIMFSPPVQQARLLPRDIHQDKVSGERVSNGGGDFYAPFWWYPPVTGIL